MKQRLPDELADTPHIHNMHSLLITSAGPIPLSSISSVHSLICFVPSSFNAATNADFVATTTIAILLYNYTDDDCLSLVSRTENADRETLNFIFSIFRRISRVPIRIPSVHHPVVPAVLLQNVSGGLMRQLVTGGRVCLQASEVLCKHFKWPKLGIGASGLGFEQRRVFSYLYLRCRERLCAARRVHSRESTALRLLLPLTVRPRTTFLRVNLDENAVEKVFVCTDLSIRW